MIEGHHDIRSPTELQFHCRLRCELMMAAVDVGAKRNSVLANSHVPGQAENLEPPAIGQDGSVPAHEPMQPAGGDEGFQTRSQHAVVGVGKNDLRPCGAYFFWKKGLDRALGPDRHERGSLDDSVAGGHSSPAGAAGAIDRQHVKPKWTRHPIVGRSGVAGRAYECGSEYG